MARRPVVDAEASGASREPMKELLRRVAKGAVTAPPSESPAE